MSFLFGKKKQSHNPLPPATRDTHTPGGSSIPAANGAKSKERGPNVAQTSTPGSGTNTSITLVGGTNTPSPDQAVDQRGGPDSDRSVSSFHHAQVSFASAQWANQRKFEFCKLRSWRFANLEFRVLVWSSKWSLLSRPQ